ncbi:GNAT family N-acetyltransferase [Proteiniborus sp. MB09-C3]|uniref:GNAT family N-acetyltransferase n=1 Tax=Proteiniborus sp. MB09-C3 TaxID=3050072 RepID=UPI002553EFEE|nr:GNAT family N-acetyltransferase [Proteiniborus sp. MB09-C3]WIV12939.1 GNAT family N-acetyltransferase [Proteiniborus sp. MB09-C3]
MKFQNMEPRHVKEALALALEEYGIECTKCPQLIKRSFEKELEAIIQRLFRNKYGKVAVENGKVIGYLAFEEPRDGFHGNVKGAFSPLGGSAFAGDNRDMLASKLLQEVTADLVADGICSFALSRYAHDEEVGRSLVMNGFGIRCSDAIMKLSFRTKISDFNEDIRFQELVKDDKKEISRLKKELIKHLCSAPTFFPANIAHYDNWFENDRIRVFVAKENNRVIGYMSLDTEAETFVSESDNIYNICGAYVDKEYRNKGIAQQLLEHLCEISEREGKEYLGVDCETLNPTALRFWGKYFENYTYGYARRIDERVLGYDKYLENEWN